MVEDRRTSNHNHTPCCTRSQFVQNQTAVFILHKNLLHYEFVKPWAVEIFPRENFFLHFHRVPGKVGIFLSNLWLASKFHSRHGNTWHYLIGCDGKLRHWCWNFATISQKRCRAQLHGAVRNISFTNHGRIDRSMEWWNTSLSVLEVWLRSLSRQRFGIAAMCLRSCVAQALNRGDGSCRQLHASP